MGPDIVPDILPFLEFLSHRIEIKADGALLIEFPFIRSVRYLHIGIFFRTAGMGKVMGQIELPALPGKLLLKWRAIICLHCSNGKRKFIPASQEKIASVAG